MMKTMTFYLNVPIIRYVSKNHLWESDADIVYKFMSKVVPAKPATLVQRANKVPPASKTVVVGFSNNFTIFTYFDHMFYLLA